MHRQALDAEIKTWSEARPYAVITEEDLETRHKLYRVHETVPPDLLGWGIILGDAVHNLRAALDHVAWQLAASLTRPPDHTEFPIFHDSELFHATDKKGHPTHGSGLGKIIGLRTDSKALVERAQPYHRGHEAHLHPLWVLSRLDNVDKHRIVIPAVFIPQEIVADFSVNTNESRRLDAGAITFRTDPLVDQAVILTIDPSRIDCDVQVNVPEISFEVCIDVPPLKTIPGSRQGITALLSEAAKEVNGVIADASEFV